MKCTFSERSVARAIGEEIEAENGVIVRTGNDLKVVELKTKDTAGVFGQSPGAQRRLRTRIQSSEQVPDFDFP